jgi:biotin synthesis protein BioG
MKLYWHKKENNDRLILLFNGWGCDENIIRGVDKTGYDMLLVYDYTNVEAEKLQCIGGYEVIDVLAWSFGVMVADRCMGEISNIGKRIAVNGSLYPIDNERGIPEMIFQKTLQTYNDENRKKFFIRMMGGLSRYTAYEGFLPGRTTFSQLEELQSLAVLAGQPPSQKQDWNLAVISKNDRIFPSANMSNAWADISYFVEGSHFVDFQQLINDYI